MKRVYNPCLFSIDPEFTLGEYGNAHLETKGRSPGRDAGNSRRLPVASLPTTWHCFILFLYSI